MAFKENLKKTFSKTEDIVLYRYKASKFVFIIVSFLFIINFYFVGANFYIDFFQKTLSFTYILVLISLLFYIYFLFKKLLISKIPIILFILIFFILLLGVGFLMLPVVFDTGFNYILNLSK